MKFWDKHRFVDGALTLLIWTIALGGLGTVLAWSGGPTVWRPLAADLSTVGLFIGAVHLAIAARRRRAT